MKKRPIINIIIILLAIAIGLAIRITRERKSAPAPKPPTTHQQTVEPNETTGPKETAVAQKEVEVYRVKAKGTQAVLYPTRISVKAGDDPKLTAVQALFTPEKTPNAINIIPRGTRLLSFTTEGDTATIDLSKEFKTHFGGGSEEEGLLISSILNTLKQFPEIKHVRLLIDGGTLDTLGHIDLSEPLGVDDAGTEYGGEN